MAGIPDLMVFSPFGTQLPAYLGGALGSGVDGAVTLDGVAAFPGMNRAGAVYTMTRDQQFTTLTVNAGITLISGGYRIYARGVITNNGTIGAPGNAAAGAVAAPSLGSGTLAGASAGAAGGTGAGAAGAALVGASNCSVGASGAGGTGTSGAGGAGVNAVSASLVWWNTVYPLLAGVVGIFGTAKSIGGGLPGGSGAGDGVNSGGGGGGGGGTLGIICQQLINNGLLTTNGGRGGDAPAGNCGGGGGGGGGLILVYSLVASVIGTATAAAGGSGLGIGTGTNGGPGTAGAVINMVLA